MRARCYLALAALLALPVTAVADSAAAVEKQVESNFKKGIAAFAKGSLKTFMALCAEDYEGLGMDGKKMGKAELRAQMEMHLKSTKKVNSARYDVTGLKVNGNKATGKAKFNLDADIIDPEGMMGEKGKTHRMQMEEVSDVTWVKRGGVWLVQKERPTGPPKMMIDGKPMGPQTSAPAPSAKIKK